MKNILIWLEGKKTYITAGIFAIFNFGVAVGLWALDNNIWIAINSVLAALGLSFLRAGVDKVEKSG